MTPQERTEVEGLIREKKLIEAIKAYRRITGAGLAEAKAAVDAIAADPARVVLERATDEVNSRVAGMDRVRQLIAEGKKIEAIRVYREIHGGGLKDSKDAVDALEKGLPAGTHVKAGVTKQGCLGLLVLAVGGVVGYGFMLSLDSLLLLHALHVLHG